MNTTQSFHGITVPMITPLAGRDRLDHAGLERLVEHLIGGGVRGVFVLGTTGEGPGLGYGVRRELITRTCRLVAGRAAVLVGISDTACGESLAMAAHAADSGADAVVLAPPYYLSPSQEELLDYVRRLAGELPLPLLLYNVPAVTKIAFDCPTVRGAMDEPNIIGLKDSSRDMIYFRTLCEQLGHRPDWLLLTGTEELLAEAMSLGAAGGVCGGANVFPSLYVALHAAANAADAQAVQPLHDRVLQVARCLYPSEGGFPVAIRTIKCALSCLGICDDLMAEPFHRAHPQERASISRAVEQLRG